MLDDELRRLLAEIRNNINSGEILSVDNIETISKELHQRLSRLIIPEGRRAINATGILLHTGLGRSPLCEEAIEAMMLPLSGAYGLCSASNSRTATVSVHLRACPRTRLHVHLRVPSAALVRVVLCFVLYYKAGVLFGVRRLSISTAMGGLLGTGQ